jgi:hypothetical protein
MSRPPNLVTVVALVWGLVTPILAAAGEPAGERRAATILVKIGDRSELERLTRLVSIEDVRGLEVQAVASPSQLEGLRAAGYTWQILPSVTGKADDLTMCPPDWEDDPERSWSCYPSYPQYEALMRRFVSERPDLCRLVDLGPSTNTVRRHRLWAVIVSDNPDDDEDEPEVLLTSTMHGNETAGFVLMLRLIDHLVSGYGVSSETTALVDATEIWINPLANPDGTYYESNDTVAGAIRNYTTTTGGDSGLDPNRSFPNPMAGTYSEDQPWWPETQEMIALADSKTFVLSANFHGGAEVVNYPWDTWERRHPDNLWFRALARDWADLARTDGPAGYMTGISNSGITNGYDWYQTIGGRQDFMTFFHGGRELTIELSETKLLPTAELDNLWLWNRRALLDFIAHAQRGIRGVVTNGLGRPLAATIEVLGVDREADGSTVRSDPAVGDYHRLLLPGLYDLEVRSSGCLPLQIPGVAVIDGEATRLDAELQCTVFRRPGRRIVPSIDRRIDSR